MLYGMLRGKWGQVLTSNYVVLESTLLLGGRISRTTARSLPRFIKDSGIQSVCIDEEVEARATSLFVEDERISLTDSTTLVLVRELRIPNLATYDSRSFVGHSLNLVGQGYWRGLEEKEQREALKAIGSPAEDGPRPR